MQKRFERSFDKFRSPACLWTRDILEGIIIMSPFTICTCCYWPGYLFVNRRKFSESRKRIGEDRPSNKGLNENYDSNER